MSPIVVALVTITACALCGWPIRTGWRRSRFGCERPSFRCRLAVWDSANAGFGGAFDQGPVTVTWCRFKARATWRGDVLVIRRSWLRSRNWKVSVRLPVESSIHDECPTAVRGLGAHPQSLIIPQVGTVGTQGLKIAVRQGDRDLLAGPFVVMAFATSG